MLRVAIIGYRVQGSRHHAPAFAALDDCRIVAVCDTVEARAREGAARYDVPAYTDVDELLANEAFEIADIPVGERFRHELVIKCLRCGKHVFTEKPLAAAEGQFAISGSDIPVAREMVEEWQKHDDLQFGVCFGLHGAGNVRWAKRVVRSGVLGRFTGMHVVTQHNSWNHVLDLVRFFGGGVRTVSAHADDVEAMNVKSAALTFVNGGTATVASFRKLGLQYQIKWVGDKGEIVVNNIAGDACWTLHDSLETTHYDEARTLRRTSYLTIFDELIADFVDAVRGKRSFVADAWAGLRHIELDAAITDSIRSGRGVDVQCFSPGNGATVFDPTDA